MKKVRNLVCTILISVVLLVSFVIVLPEENYAASVPGAVSTASSQIVNAAAKTITVYYTPKGTKYHKTKKCRTLKRSKKIYKKKIKASKIKKSKKCKVCWH